MCAPACAARGRGGDSPLLFIHAGIRQWPCNQCPVFLMVLVLLSMTSCLHQRRPHPRKKSRHLPGSDPPCMLLLRKHQACAPALEVDIGSRRGRETGRENMTDCIHSASQAYEDEAVQVFKFVEDGCRALWHRLLLPIPPDPLLHGTSRIAHCIMVCSNALKGT